MCTIREREEGQNLGDFLVIEDVSSRELDLRANLCPAEDEHTIYWTWVTNTPSD